jgi:hypothetical protein
MHWFTSYLVRPDAKQRTTAGSADLQAAVDAYNRDHGRDWGSAGTGTCPICGHRACFGEARGKLAGAGRWACFSANHGNVGVRLGGCFHGDALDVDAEAAGRTRIEHLTAAGYLHARPRQSPQERKATVSPTTDTPANKRGHSDVPHLTEYETEWVEDMTGRLQFDGTLNYTPEAAHAEALRRLRVIQERERGARHA